MRARSNAECEEFPHATTQTLKLARVNAKKRERHQSSRAAAAGVRAKHAPVVASWTCEAFMRLSTECMAQEMRKYSRRGQVEEPLFSMCRGNPTPASRDIRIRNVRTKRTREPSVDGTLMAVIQVGDHAVVVAHIRYAQAGGTCVLIQEPDTACNVRAVWRTVGSHEGLRLVRSFVACEA
jgi:hypothetical protein